MGPSSLASFIRRLRRLVEPRGGGLDDAELLKRFAAERDEAAFEVLLWRYGPLVLSVCRRMLWREQDIEDAFQATFLTLVRKAGSIARREALGGWLHQVAYRIGLRARARATRHGIPDQERVEIAVAHSQHNDDGEWREVLDQEVQRLPSRYRTPFIFCYLEGKTHAEAARLLACPPGTVASRLAWARDRLRRRLTARGLTLPAVLACLVVPAELQAASLAVLIVTALRTARLFTTGISTGPGTIPAHVTAWSKGAVRAMFLSKIQMAATLVLVCTLAGAGGGVVWQRVQAGGDSALADEPAVQAAAQPQPKPKIATPAEAKPAAVPDNAAAQMELAKAESDYLALVDKWEKQIDPARRELLERQQDQRQRKARLAFEVKRKSRALDLAESRVEKLTQALDQAVEGAVGVERLQKNLQEANKQVVDLSAELLKSEMILAEEDSPFNRLEHEIESLEKRHTFEIARARKRVEAAERKLHPAANDAADGRLQELERKVDALTRAMEDLRKALRR